MKIDYSTLAKNMECRPVGWVVFEKGSILKIGPNPLRVKRAARIVMRVLAIMFQDFGGADGILTVKSARLQDWLMNRLEQDE